MRQKLTRSLLAAGVAVVSDMALRTGIAFAQALPEGGDAVEGANNIIDWLTSTLAGLSLGIAGIALLLVFLAALAFDNFRKEYAGKVVVFIIIIGFIPTFLEQVAGQFAIFGAGS